MPYGAGKVARRHIAMMHVCRLSRREVPQAWRGEAQEIKVYLDVLLPTERRKEEARNWEVVKMEVLEVLDRVIELL